MTDYDHEALSSLLSGGEGEPFRLLTVLSNASAYLFDVLSDVSWVGFYLYQDGFLYLGPFQGKTACVRIPLGKGVCGTAAEERKTIIVPDVHRFPGHIACDSTSKSEIVVPMVGKKGLFGVLDVDSRTEGRFREGGKEGVVLEDAAKVILSVLDA